MKLTETIVAAVLGLAAVVNGHMEMTSPPPFRSKYNTLGLTANDIDYSMTNPLDATGIDFPCKGYHKLLGTALGASMATWAPGGSYSFSVTGGANHFGGSCQASLSYDKGKTFKVIHSWIGECPPKGDSTWPFTVPTDAPAGEALFAWTWFNQVGNREMYMNCAVVTIGAGKKRDASIPFSSRPDIFVANVGNDVCTWEGKDVQFPNPGPEVDNDSVKGTIAPGQGKCKGEPPAGAPPAAPPAGQPAASSVQGPVAAPPQGTQPAGAYPPASKVPGGVFITIPVGQQPPATAKPTTIASLTSQAPAVTSSQPKTSPPPAAATSAAPPAPQPTKPASGGSSPSNGAVTAGSACSSEGQWSCASDGKSFQRCASGMWSVSMPVAPGTSCQPGTSDSLTLVNKRSGSDFVRRRRFVSERFQRERALA
ncbi:CAZyme family AA11 [Trichoderma aggressivum f. europaeum]|uniref:CAZyme family AA11 n=1 Tax=Trichoderma aggressivum f. europaeum TaxID=173218 RepID=A0AAE1ICE7_9HYPO|nr:CAZyme family AA11 [Trichoderma aggressivum f. europaeum]